jgi:hypothetical protein
MVIKKIFSDSNSEDYITKHDVFTKYGDYITKRDSFTEYGGYSTKSLILRIRRHNTC